MSITEEIAALEQQRVDAINRQDLATLRALLADDYQHCHATGVVQAADEAVAHVGKNPRTIEPRSPLIRVYGDSAVLTGELRNVLMSSGAEPLVTQLWATQVVSRIAGRWRFVAFQATRTVNS